MYLNNIKMEDLYKKYNLKPRANIFQMICISYLCTVWLISLYSRGITIKDGERYQIVILKLQEDNMEYMICVI